MLFSIVTVSFNSGDKLRETVLSVLSQTYKEFEIIVKDGQSTDDSLGKLPTDERIRVVSERDSGIYDAMNAAMKYVRGDYVLFLNCGDYLFESNVLERVNEFIRADGAKKGFYYGDIFYRSRGSFLRLDGELTNYRLMTRTICHQAIFFSRDSFQKLQYRPEKYRLAADMDLYVRVLKQLGGEGIYMSFPVCSYEGEGASDKSEGRKEILREKKAIMKECLSQKEYMKVKILKILTLQALKEKIGTISWFRSGYEKLAALKYSIMSCSK